jgi:hypothetical protein
VSDQDDAAIAAITCMSDDRLCGKDALFHLRDFQAFDDEVHLADGLAGLAFVFDVGVSGDPIRGFA